MNSTAMVDALERFGKVLPAVVESLLERDACWQPPPEGQHWSILQIIMHLCDEEVEDFRTRLRLTLEHPEADWPGIDPQGWAIQRQYHRASLADAVQRFITERRSSVQWLRHLHHPDWTRAHQHPKIGAIRAGDLLASWVAHDALHLRQIAKRMHQLAQRHAGEYSTRYAGEW